MKSIVFTDTELKKGDLNNWLSRGFEVVSCVKLDTKYNTLFILKQK